VSYLHARIGIMGTWVRIFGPRSISVLRGKQEVLDGMSPVAGRGRAAGT
jgi:hypothetical protein